MTLALRVLDPVADELWDRIADTDPTATIFHTRAWAESASASYRNARIATQAFELDDGALAVLPLLERRFGPFKVDQSAPDATFGGPIAERPLSNDEVASILRSRSTPKLGRMSVNGNPYASWSLAFLGRREERPFTQAVDLTDGFDAAFARFNTTCRRNVRIGARAGLEVTKASSAADFEAYYAAYRDTLQRWGRQAVHRVPPQRFLSLRDHLGERFCLWLVKKDGRVLGGICVLYHNGRAFYWHGAYLREAFQFRAPNFIQSEVMREACERGIQWFDLGTSAGMEGVVRFKDGFGPRRLFFERGVIGQSALFDSAFRIRSAIRGLTGR